MSVAVIEEPQILPPLDILFAEQCRLPPSSTNSSEPPSPSPLSDSITSQNDPMSQLASSTSTYTTASASASPSASPSASASTSSLPAASRSVKFAPLPELGPRKRRSNAPLGMAARGALARRRRPNGAGLGSGVVIVAVAGSGPPDIPPDVPAENIRYVTPAEFEQHRMQQEAMAARYAQHQGLAAAMAARELEAEQEAEYEREEREREIRALEEEEKRASGKKVKKGFWKRVVQHRESESALRKDGDRTPPTGKVESEAVLRRTKSDMNMAAPLPPSRTSTPPVPPLRPILNTVKSAPAVTKAQKDDDPLPPLPTAASDATIAVTTEDIDAPRPSTDDSVTVRSPTPTPESRSSIDDTKTNDDP